MTVVAALAQHREVRLCGGVLVHVVVHRRGQHQGQPAASALLVSMSSAIPAVSLAIVLAEAGAMSITSALRDQLKVADRIVTGRR